VFAVLDDFTPNVEPVSIDEAFLDIGGLRLQYPAPDAVAHAIRAAIRTTCGLPCSVGVAATKMLAKMASQEAKPDGVFRIAAGSELDFLHPLPVRRLWGVGEATHAALERLGVGTVGDLAAIPRQTLMRHLGHSAGQHLADLAAGLDPRPVTPTPAAKSISVEETFERDLTNEEAVRSRLFELSNRLSHRLRRAGKAGRTVVLKVRYPDFETLTRRRTMAAALSTEADIWSIVLSLYESLPRRVPIRLLGVGVASLERGAAPRQMTLAADSSGEIGEVADRIRDRFGDDAIRPARLSRRRDSDRGDAGATPPNTP
jgi:DNA polymerase-4